MSRSRELRKRRSCYDRLRMRVILARRFPKENPAASFATQVAAIIAILCGRAAPALRGGSVCLNNFGRFVKWISASIMPPPSSVPAC